MRAQNTSRIGKRGIEQEFLVVIILTIIGFLIILGLAIRTGYLSNVEAETNLCRVTLAAQELSRIGVGGLKTDSPLSSACKRRTIDVLDKGVFAQRTGPDQKLPIYTKEGMLLRGTTNYDLEATRSQEYRQEALASYFSESMRRCWLRGLEGEVEVFNPREAWYEVFDTKSVCMLCDETHVRLSATQNTKGVWLSTYIQNTIMPGDPEKRTYGEYLYTLLDGENEFFPDFSPRTSTAQSICLEEKNINQNPVIRDGSYATIFFRDFSSDETGCMAVAVVPAQQVRSLCDYVAN